ncbi:membrane dipeptidase [Aliikangiella marina]|uniref:Membrane dipeptidase n=1 Tax=Aliikangiella marina TaxID=1712262 RepID=A0A545TD01_9GAMM|nr:dipeptidase [Aliikangiella marina]TQV75071.1 membrane dipeptidase [Aliikangiella marina]
MTKLPIKNIPFQLAKSLAIGLTIVSLAACQPGENSQEKNTTAADTSNKKPVTEQRSSQVSTSAAELAQKYIIADLHVDVPYRLENKFEDVAKATESGDFDYPRAVEGGLNAPFMSIYIPAKLQEEGGSKALADKLIDGIEKLITDSPDKFAPGRSVAEVEAAFKKGLIALPLGMENGSPLEGKLENLEHFYKRGIRYITLAHSKANHISDSSYDENRPAKGLTEFGKKLITEMNNIGIMIDISHVSDEAFFQVMQLSNVPAIASHSSARHFTPGFERNMSDDMIKLLAEKGGVIFINFGSTFVSQKSRDNWDKYSAARKAFMEENKVAQNSEEVKQFTAEYRQATPFEFATTEDVLDHFDHVVKLVGIDHVGIGSDYDGVGDSLPTGLKDVSTYPNLIQGLIDRGYSEQDIAKILSGNLMRVWKQVEDYAANN